MKLDNNFIDYKILKESHMNELIFPNEAGTWSEIIWKLDIVSKPNGFLGLELAIGNVFQNIHELQSVNIVNGFLLYNSFNDIASAELFMILFVNAMIVEQFQSFPPPFLNVNLPSLILDYWQFRILALRFKFAICKFFTS